MFEKFGEFDSYEEINRAAKAQLEEGESRQSQRRMEWIRKTQRTFAPVQSSN